MLPEICDALDRVGIVEPFPIQEMTLPVALMGTDLIGQARTGTGKTLGFGIPLLQRTISPGEPDYDELAAPGKPQALVVTPTRELTIQVAKDLTTASTVRTVRVLTIYGGVAYEPQLDALKSGVDVVVGTPGRLLDLANRGVLDLGHIKVLVLDEADEMLDLGFLPDVERILRKTPELRQTMLFSATMPSAVIGLARTHMRHPLNIRAESHEDTQMVPTTAQFVYRAHDLDKPEVVARILQADDRGRVMIFCRTKREASRLTDDLIDRGFKAAAIHGDLNQQARERALTRFRGDKIDVLVCTDVAARGIDVGGVTHVINNTCPEDEKTYIHRIGRTGRAGASGIAVTFVDWPDLTRWKVINKALDLPYDEPQEIYSTSPELYHDLGIPTDAKGRIRPPRAPKEVAEARDERGAGRRGGRPERENDRPGRKRNRSRKRTRAGQPVEELADVTTKTEVPAVTDGPGAEEAPARKPRKRTRNRRPADRTPADTTVATETAATETVASGTAAPEVVEARSVEAESVEAHSVEAPAEKPAKRTRTRKSAASTTTEPAATVESSASTTAAPEAGAAESAEKPAKRTRTRKSAASTTADAAATVESSASTTAAPEAGAAESAEKPVKRTRTRKAAASTTAEAGATAAEAAADAAEPAEKPAQRTRARKTAAAEAAAAEAAAPAAEAAGDAEKPVKRAAKKAAAAKKTAKKTAKAAPKAAVETAPETAPEAAPEAAPKKATKKATKQAAKKTVKKAAKKAPTAPIFSAPE
ncbi:DEAD/DEAH box helicase [Kribbella sp. NPDC004875]|uniref:DEAD/DEAH box helicase n=1 Tax=Kribbella sp. NPDC004875 TaxID=3364107 RepID=UPI0036838B81